MQRVARAMTGDRANLVGILNFRGPGDASNIVSTSARGRPEIGPNVGRIHQHILLTIRHTVPGRGIHVRPDAIRRFYRATGTTPAVQNTAYVNVHGFSSIEVVDEYIDKGDIPDTAADAVAIARELRRGT